MSKVSIYSVDFSVLRSLYLSPASLCWPKRRISADGEKSWLARSSMGSSTPGATPTRCGVSMECTQYGKSRRMHTKFPSTWILIFTQPGASAPSRRTARDDTMPYAHASLRSVSSAKPPSFGSAEDMLFKSWTRPPTSPCSAGNSASNSRSCARRAFSAGLFYVS